MKEIRIPIYLMCGAAGDNMIYLQIVLHNGHSISWGSGGDYDIRGGGEGKFFTFSVMG